MTSDPWDEINLQQGLLTDEDIITLGKEKLLITENFEEQQVHQTCYELRVGDIGYYLLRDEPNRKVTIDPDHPLILRPGDVVTILTKEEVALPDDMIGRIFSKGHLFSIGLSPVVTLVDPGFSGHLGITFINHSKKRLSFVHEDLICKIEFVKLNKKVKNPYKGPHNYAEQIWPVDYSRFLPKRKITEEMLKKESLDEEFSYHGEPYDLINEYIKNKNKSLNEKINKLKGFNKVISIILIGILSFNLLSIILSKWEIIPQNIIDQATNFIGTAMGVAIIYVFNKLIKSFDN